MTDGLKDAHRAAIIAALAANNRVERAVLFGSRATGTNTVTSAVDIALFGDRLTLTDQAHLAVAVDEIPMAQSVDLILYDSVSDRTLREHIRREGIEWYTQPRSTHSDPDDWPMVRLGDHAESCLGKMLDQRKNRGELLPYLGNKNVRWGSFDTRELGRMRFEQHEHDRYGLKYGDLVVCEGGEPGRCAIWKDELPGMKIQKALHRIRAGDQLDNRFLHYWFLLAGRNGALEPYFTGTTIKHLTGRAIADLQIPLPFLSEQRGIAHVLGTLDDKIELNRRMNEILEAMTRALFKSWLVDFDPVRAKMEGRDTGLPDGISDLFPDRLVDSEMGKIPEGWEVVPLDVIARFRNGLALQKFRPAGNEARLPVVKIAQMRTGEANSGEWASAAIKPECIIEDGDVLFSWSGSLLVMMWCGGRAALNQHLFRVTSNRYPKWFYLHSLLSHLPAFRQIAQDKATTMGHIRRHHLTEALCVCPPSGVIAELTDMFSCLLDRQLATELNSRTLAALREALLPKLISGEIRVPTTDRGPTQ
ncbi:MAG: restriction endonuclease subunit S [Gemmatimonadetes bacterium]|nr:restriction endonuclease subunit S [Candidatus Palauibacter rhopaloidicola]